jgi:hypothetical protein
MDERKKMEAKVSLLPFTSPISSFFQSSTIAMAADLFGPFFPYFLLVMATFFLRCPKKVFPNC